jgi:hypothetical protein
MPLFLFAFFLIFLPFILFLYFRYKHYKQTEYYQETGNRFFKVFFDSGLRGEYFVTEEFSKTKKYHKILVNVYLPTIDGGTSETDVIYIDMTGIYVIESKNYNGWIYGNETDRNWTAVLNKVTKNKFYNPIMQNHKHLKVLMQNLSEVDTKVFQPMVVFGEGATLKKVTINDDTVVINRRDVGRTMKELATKKGTFLTSAEINKIYYTLKPFTQVSDEVKSKHVEGINKKTTSK